MAVQSVRQGPYEDIDDLQSLTSFRVLETEASKGPLPLVAVLLGAGVHYILRISQRMACGAAIRVYMEQLLLKAFRNHHGTEKIDFFVKPDLHVTIARKSQV